MTPPVTSDGATSLRGFWLLSAAVGLAAVVLAATIARAGMQIDRIEATIDTAAQTRSARVDEALSSWGVAWLDTWLRERELLEADRAALGVCLEVYLRDLDRVSVSGNVVRFGHIEKARKGAVSCVAEVLGPHHAQDFVAQLQQRWGDFLEQRGETAPRLTEGGRRGQPGGGPGGGPGASRGGPPGGGPPGGGPGGGPGGERRGPPPKGRGPGAGGGPGR